MCRPSVNDSRSQTKKENNAIRNVTPVCIIEEKYPKDCGSRQAIINVVVKEQFVKVLPDEVRVWAEEWKFRISEEARKLAEDYIQTRKKRQTPQNL